MSAITNSGNFIAVTDDQGKLYEFNKENTKYSVKGNIFSIGDNSGQSISLIYTQITAPTSTNINNLRDQITAFFP